MYTNIWYIILDVIPIIDSYILLIYLITLVREVVCF
jgi:hypothetical protein